MADKYHATKLLPPAGDFKRYRVQEWLNFISTELHKTCSSLYNKGVPEEIKEKVYRPTMKRKLDYIESQLAKKQYLLCNQFTLADSYLFVVLSWLPHMGMTLNQWPALSRYFEQVRVRPSVQKALAEEDLLNSINP